jgi:plastocyanin
MKPLLLAAAAVALGLLGASPMPSPTVASTPGATASAAPAAVVHMHDFAFVPETVTVQAGQSVEWINDDAIFHSATAADASWGSGELDQRRSYLHLFEKPGTYDYYCDDHSYMRARVVVK